MSWATWLLFTGAHARCVVSRVQCPGQLGSCSPVCMLGALCCMCGVLGHFAPVRSRACSVHCVACVVSWRMRLLFTGVPARCVVLRVRFPGPLGPCSPGCPLVALRCVCGLLGHLAAVHRCARSVRCGVGVVSFATCHPLICVLARCVAWRPRALGHLAPVHRCAPSVRVVACTVSWATLLLFTSAHAWCGVLRVRRPRPLGSCSPECSLGLLCCVCGVLGFLAPISRCARSVRYVACAVSWGFSSCAPVCPLLCVVLRVSCPGPLDSCAALCSFGAL